MPAFDPRDAAWIRGRVEHAALEVHQEALKMLAAGDRQPPGRSPPAFTSGTRTSKRHRPYEEGLRMYALTALGEAMRSLPEVDPRWVAAIEDALRARQREDGSFTGWSPRMREDEPAVATPLAVIALSAVLGC